MKQTNKYYTVTQLARKWAVSRQAVDQLLRRHGIEPVRLGAKIAFGKKSAYLKMFKASKIERLKLKFGKVFTKTHPPL